MWTGEEGDGRYRVLRRVGSGGMGEVLLAQDTVLQRYVALKRVHTGSDPAALRRLRREATVGASITHPNLVGIYDVVENPGGEVLIVMEYVVGDTLQALIQARGALESAKALSMLAGVGAALDAVHARGIVHRDVKPANILLGIDDSVKLTDLGIAAVEDRTRITSADLVMGTFSYMAPEQLAGAPPHPGIDIYALAAVAFEALSGQRAYPERNPVALAHAIATRPVPDLRAVRPETPAAASEVLKRGMSHDPAMRPRTAGELVGRLREALQKVPTEDLAMPGPPMTVPPRRQTAPRLGAAVLAGTPGAADPVLTSTPVAEAPAVTQAPRVTQALPAAAPRSPEPKDRARHGRLMAPLAILACLAIIGAAIAAAFASGGSTGRSGLREASAQAGRSRPRARGFRSVHGPSGRLIKHAPFKRGPAAAPQPASPAPASAAPASAPAPSPTVNPAPTGPTTPTSSSTATPGGVVQAFYEAAAHHDYASAWSLADQNMRNELQGFDSFQSQMSAVRTITFHQAQTVQQSNSSATVSLDTTAVLLNTTQHCTGTVETVLARPGQWLLDHIAISCAAE